MASSDAVTFVWPGTTVLLLADTAGAGHLVLRWRTITPR
jgi:hypothetical protein